MSENNNGHQHHEAPASATAKVKSPSGFTWLLTRRNDSAGALLKELAQLETWLTSNGWQPVEDAPRGRGSSKRVEAPPDGSTPMCPAHNKPMRASQYGGYYCSVRDDTGQYCVYKAK